MTQRRVLAKSSISARNPRARRCSHPEAHPQHTKTLAISLAALRFTAASVLSSAGKTPERPLSQESGGSAPISPAGGSGGNAAARGDGQAGSGGSLHRLASVPTGLSKLRASLDINGSMCMFFI